MTQHHIDVHCHILPGLDDGSPDDDTTGAMLQMAAECGTCDLFATPHVISGSWQPSWQTILQEVAALNEAGLATLTHTPSPVGFLREICGRPDWERPVMIVVAGHPAANATVPAHALRKKPMTQIASWL